MQITVSTTAPERSILLWGLYQETFAPAVTGCIQEQLCYTAESFQSALEDEAIVKFVVCHDDQPIGLALATFDLEKARIAYVNPVRLQQAYPDRQGRILYFTCLAIRPDWQKREGVFVTLVKELTLFTDRHQAVVAFDFSTEKNGELPQMLVRVAQMTQNSGQTQTKQARYRKLGGQEYGIIELE